MPLIMHFSHKTTSDRFSIHPKHFFYDLKSIQSAIFMQGQMGNLHWPHSKEGLTDNQTNTISYVMSKI